MTAKGPNPLIRQLRQIRIDSGLTQMEVAQRMETNQSHLSQIERGHCDPTLNTVVRFALAVGYTLVVVEE